jgi:hypothetical protein
MMFSGVKKGLVMKLLTLLFFLIISTYGWSQSTSQQLLNQNNQKKWGMNFNLNHTSNLREQNDPDKRTFHDLTLGVRNQVAKNLLINLNTVVEQDQAGETKQLDSFWGFLQPQTAKLGTVNMSQQLRVHLPTSKESVRRDFKKGGVTYIPSFVQSSGKIDLIYNPMLVKNFHEYETNRLGSQNTSHAINQNLAIFFNANDMISFGVSGLFTKSWSYNNVEKNDSYNLSTMMNVNVLPYSVSLGLSQGNSLINSARGADQNIQIFNENTTVYFISFSGVF